MTRAWGSRERRRPAIRGSRLHLSYHQGDHHTMIHRRYLYAALVWALATAALLIATNAA